MHIGSPVYVLRGHKLKAAEMKIFLYNMTLLRKSVFMKRFDLLVKILTLFSNLSLLLYHYNGPLLPPTKARNGLYSCLGHMLCLDIVGRNL